MSYGLNCQLGFHPWRLLWLLGYVFSSFVWADESRIIRQIQLMDDEFKTLSGEFYRSSTDKNSVEILDIGRLQHEVNGLVNARQPIAAIQLLYVNLATIKSNIENEAVLAFAELFLKHNAWGLAKTLLGQIENQGDQSLLASIQFSFAKYYARRNEWVQVTKRLDGVFSELATEDADYAYLLNGSALQYLKKHRLAVESHSKISASSTYYSYAQLNIAIAKIRQGWLTDAQTTIRNLIAKTQNNGDDDLTYRLNLVLGYALLQKEYYRDAREAFRNIGLDSRYANRALLGIGLTATSQGDYVGGLNALSILKGKKTFDLSVDESYLLIPYVHERLQQELSASASYTEAIAYYRERLIQLKNLSNRRLDFAKTGYAENTASLIISNNSLNYGEMFPLAFIDNYRKLIEFSSFNQSPDLNAKIERLIFKYDEVFQSIAMELIGRRVKYLSSYLNQSQYGLARLYDSSSEASN